MNLKLRAKNKVVLLALISWGVSFVYQIISALGITPAITETSVMQNVTELLDILVLLGILTDPTTKGIKDSDSAKLYDEPR